MSELGQSSVIRRCLLNVRIALESGSRPALLRCRRSEGPSLRRLLAEPRDAADEVASYALFLSRKVLQMAPTMP